MQFKYAYNSFLFFNLKEKMPDKLLFYIITHYFRIFKIYH